MSRKIIWHYIYRVNYKTVYQTKTERNFSLREEIFQSVFLQTKNVSEKFNSILRNFVISWALIGLPAFDMTVGAAVLRPDLTVYSPAEETVSLVLLAGVFHLPDGAG